MVIWDLDEDQLYPSGAVVAYVKNILHLARSPIYVDSLISAQVGHYLLSGIDADQRPVELIAPVACRSKVGETYIPAVFQKSFGCREYRWSLHGSGSRGCARIAEQCHGREFKLVSSRYAFLRFARSGKPRGYNASEDYGARVRDYIARELEKGYMTSHFRFVDIYSGSEAVVPYQPTVLNLQEPENFADVPQHKVSATERLALPSF